MVRVEDIVFWILILAIIAIAVWLLFGSPTLEAGLISVALFVAGSEILLWKAFFALDKRTAIGFERVRGNTEITKSSVDSMNSKLDKIEDSIIKLNKKLKIK